MKLKLSQTTEKEFFSWRVIVLRVRGVAQLIKRLDKSVKAVPKIKQAVKKNGSELETLTKRNASFTKGYQTGETKRSVGLTIKDAGYTAEVKPGTEWAYWLEHGTRFMSAQKFVEPSLKQQNPKFIKDIEKASKGE